MPRENYLCPRCNYSTEKKSSMNNHLFKMKKQCPSSGSDLFSGSLSLVHVDLLG